MLMYAISCFFTTILSPAYLSQLSKRFFWGEQQTLAVFFPPTGEYKPCRSRKMLQNEPTLAIGGVDTAEIWPSQVCPTVQRNLRIWLLVDYLE